MNNKIITIWLYYHTDRSRLKNMIPKVICWTIQAGLRTHTIIMRTKVARKLQTTKNISSTQYPIARNLSHDQPNHKKKSSLIKHLEHSNKNKTQPPINIYN